MEKGEEKRLRERLRGKTGSTGVRGFSFSSRFSLAYQIIQSIQTMTKKDLVSLEVAKLAEEKGFDEDCLCTYNLENLEIESALNETGRTCFSKDDVDIVRENGYNVCLAPLQSQLSRWLRNRHNIYVEPNINFTEKLTHTVEVIKILLHERGKQTKVTIQNGESKTYEEVQDKGFEQALHMI